MYKINNFLDRYVQNISNARMKKSVVSTSARKRKTDRIQPIPFSKNSGSLLGYKGSHAFIESPTKNWGLDSRLITSRGEDDRRIHATPTRTKGPMCTRLHVRAEGPLKGPKFGRPRKYNLYVQN